MQSQYVARFLWLSLLALTIVTAACAVRLPGSGKSVVVASVYPLAYFAGQIGGDAVEVRLLVPAGAEPHDWEPAPRDVAAIAGARLLVYNGVGLEPWIDRLAPALPAGAPPLIEATAGLRLLSVKVPAGGDADHGDGIDPHVWLDPELAKAQVEIIRSALTAAVPAEVAGFRQRADGLTQRLDALNRPFAQGLAQCRIRAFVTAHQAFSYPAKRYDLEQIAIAGLSPDATPSPARLAELTRLVRDRGVRTVFFEELANPAVAQTLARETRAQTEVLDPLEGLADAAAKAGLDYFGVMDRNLDALRKAMDCR